MLWSIYSAQIFKSGYSIYYSVTFNCFNAQKMSLTVWHLPKWAWLSSDASNPLVPGSRRKISDRHSPLPHPVHGISCTNWCQTHSCGRMSNSCIRWLLSEENWSASCSVLCTFENTELTLWMCARSYCRGTLQVYCVTGTVTLNLCSFCVAYFTFYSFSL